MDKPVSIAESFPPTDNGAVERPLADEGCGCVGPNITVLDNFPANRIVTEAELLVFETYFADILAEVLGGGDTTNSASSRHIRRT